MNKWIKVEEKLPCVGREVPVIISYAYQKKQTIGELRLVGNDNKNLKKEWMILGLEGWYFSDDVILWLDNPLIPE